MGYRQPPPHRPKGRRTMHDIATPMIVSVHNGTTADLAIPVWYQEIQKPVRARHHNMQWHHHVGWPSPDHPDHICQLAYEGRHYGHKCPVGHDHCHRTCSHYIDMTQVIPIHLLSEYENYDGNSATVVFDEKPDGLTATAEIDPVEDWVVRVRFNSKVPDAIKEVVWCHFSVFISSKATTSGRYDHKTGQAKTRTVPPRTDVIAHGLLQILPSAYQ